MEEAASIMLKEYLNIMATERMVAIGWGMFLPALSGVLPGMGWYIAGPVSPIEAEGSIPIEPVSVAASSDKMSPNMFSVTITSNWRGFLTSCMAQLSTYMWLKETSL